MMDNNVAISIQQLIFVPIVRLVEQHPCNAPHKLCSDELKRNIGAAILAPQFWWRNFRAAKSVPQNLCRKTWNQISKPFTVTSIFSLLVSTVQANLPFVSKMNGDGEGNVALPRNIVPNNNVDIAHVSPTSKVVVPYLSMTMHECTVLHESIQVDLRYHLDLVRKYVEELEYISVESYGIIEELKESIIERRQKTQKMCSEDEVDLKLIDKEQRIFAEQQLSYNDVIDFHNRAIDDLMSRLKTIEANQKQLLDKKIEDFRLEGNAEHNDHRDDDA
jgi:hypothetical protein